MELRTASPGRPNDELRVGVFYDGGWFSWLWRWVNEDSEWARPLSFHGLHGMVQWHLARHSDLPPSSITISCADYVLGRPSQGSPGQAAREWDAALRRAGITRHDARFADGHEVDADQLLADIMEEQAAKLDLDVVVLVSGDVDFWPAVERLAATRTVMIPRIKQAFPSRANRVGTSERLLAAADLTPPWTHLIADALEPDYPLPYPFVHPLRPGHYPPADRGGWRLGTINGWQTRHRNGFITDRAGNPWYTTLHAFPAGTRTLPEGQCVRFQGRPIPQPGRTYPYAHTVRPYQP